MPGLSFTSVMTKEKRRSPACAVQTLSQSKSDRSSESRRLVRNGLSVKEPQGGTQGNGDFLPGFLSFNTQEPTWIYARPWEFTRLPWAVPDNTWGQNVPTQVDR